MQVKGTAEGTQYIYAELNNIGYKIVSQATRIFYECALSNCQGT